MPHSHWTLFIALNVAFLGVLMVFATVVVYMLYRLSKSDFQLALTRSAELMQRVLEMKAGGEDAGIVQQAAAALALCGIGVAPERLVEVNRSDCDLKLLVETMIVMKAANVLEDPEAVVAAAIEGKLEGRYATWLPWPEGARLPVAPPDELNDPDATG